MRIILERSGIVCAVVGLLATTAVGSTPTFTMKLAGTKKPGQSAVIFRDLACDPDADDCETLAGPGSKCVDTEVQQIPGFWRDRCSPLDQLVTVRCVGGPTPGIPCSIDNDCGFRGACRRLALPASHCVGGLAEGAPCTIDAECGSGGTCAQGSIVPLLCRDGPTPGEPCREDAACGTGGFCDIGFVEPGDQIMLEVFLSGWDQDPEIGICTDRRTPCTIGGPPCPGRHCDGDGSPCNFGWCPDGQQCVPDECNVSPLLGAFQWTPDQESFASQTVANPNATMYPVRFPCTTDVDCRRNDFPCITPCVQCCPWCGPGNECSMHAAAYIDPTRADFLFSTNILPLSCGLDAPGLSYGCSALAALVDEQKQEYVGTLWLEVPNQGAGTYYLELIDKPTFTFVADQRGQAFDAVNVQGLQIEVFDPCKDFDVDIECDPPLNVCREVECVSVNGVPTCVQLERDCVAEVAPGYGCVIAEGGCVSIRACCLPTGRCRVRSEAECDSQGGSWFYKAFTCDGDPDPCDPLLECVGPVDWDSSVPPGGVLDARQPRDVNDGITLQGIKTIVVTGVPDLEHRCFAICETESEDLPNSVMDVVEAPPGTYTITLRRRITPGAVTTITFDRYGPFTSTGVFRSLPGDVNAGETSDADDIIELIECCLNETCTPAFGEYSCDIDHSGRSAGSDLLRLIDVLNGAGSFAKPWFGEVLSPFGCQ